MSKLKKFFVIATLAVFLFSIFQLSKVFGETVPFVISSVNVTTSSTDVSYEDFVYDDTNVTNKVTFRNVGDYIKYTITLKNTSSKKYTVKLDSVEDENEKDFIQYQYDNCDVVLAPNEEKTIDVYARFVNDWTDINDRVQSEKFNLVFSYDEKVDPVPPQNVPENNTNTTPANTTPENTTPENTTPANTVPENTIPENTTPENTTPVENVVPYVTPSGKGGSGKGRRVRNVSGDYDDTIAPYATLPQTGDKIILYVALASASAVLLVVLLRKNKVTVIQKRYKVKKAEKVNANTNFGMPRFIVRSLIIVGVIAIFIPVVVKASSGHKISIKNTVYLYNKLEVNFVVDGQETSQFIGYNEKITKPSDPVKNGYKFLGWFDSNDNPFDFDSNIIEDTSIKAKFELKEYGITYNLDGGTVSEGNLTTYTINDEFTLNNPSKTGYEFDGWLKNGATTPVKDMTVSHEYGNITFTACYTPNHYTIVFNGNGDGDVEGSTESQEFTYDVAQNLNENGFTRPDKVFTGWNTRSDGNGDSYGNKESVKNLATNGTKTLYAQWRDLETYTVTFDTVGYGTSGEASRTVKEGKPIGTLPKVTSNRDAYKFDAWYLEPEYNTKVTESTVITGNTRLYAKYKIKMQTVFSCSDEVTFNKGAEIDTEDERFKGATYINTGLQLFSSTNIGKEFEITFDVVNFDADNSEKQGTMVGCKYEKAGWNYPGFVYRRYNDTSNVEVAARVAASGSGYTKQYDPSDITSIKIIRKNDNLYYSINGNETLTQIGSINTLYQRGITYTTPLTFGAALTESNAPMRYAQGTIKNIVVKLEVD